MADSRYFYRWVERDHSVESLARELYEPGRTAEAIRTIRAINPQIIGNKVRRGQILLITGTASPFERVQTTTDLLV